MKISSFGVLAAEIAVSAIVVLFLFRKNNVNKDLIKSELMREIFILVALASYGIFCLTKVHLNYTGSASSFLQPVFEAVGVSYPYPFFADEWHAVALTQKSLSNGLMPFYYPYSAEALGFVNVQWIFHNFNTGIFQFLSLEPLTSYVNLGIAINILIVMFCYLILRSLSVSRMSAIFSSALIFFITHASNFPTVWSYLPIHLGILFFLAGVLSLNFGKRTLGLFFWGITFLSYPPLIIFMIPFIWYGRKKISFKGPLIYFSVAILLFVAVLLFNSQMATNSFSIGDYLLSRLIFLKPTPEINDILNPFALIPWAAIGLAVLGLAEVRKRQPIIVVILILVSLFWLVYSQTPWRFIIDYPRVAFVGSIFICFVAGFGLDRLTREHSKFQVLRNLICIGYLCWSGFYYTQLNKGQSIEVQLNDGSKRSLTVRPPANLVLHPDDLRIAKKLKGEFLVSDPWKSTVLATAADIRPLFLKSGTISDLSPMKYDDFTKDICASLKAYWRMRYYIYLHESMSVNCEGTILQESSSEKFNLYFHAGVPH